VPGFLPGKEITLIVGTLFVVGAPASHPDDLSLRAKRILGEASLVISENQSLQALLNHHEIAVSFVWLPSPVSANRLESIIDSLKGADVALLYTDLHAASTGPSGMVIRAAIERAFPVTPLPGPSLPLTALVVSGLPADSFVYLGQLPCTAMARTELLACIAAERRTLVALVSPEHVFETVSQMNRVLGDRPLAVISSDRRITGTWRGTMTGLLARQCSWPSEVQLVLVIGGCRMEDVRWDEERLWVGIESYMDQGMGATETSRQLAIESGWPRREIYRLVVGRGKTPIDE
jgi:16S rRNA (cytidine1402-2'-O)-methyltransferase